ncbi:MAG: tRNA pseudouridine(55) synthase TruB [Lachnospiraceae bacterium]|nr:tRNA pseudouridine(55) synthase TruB [Lachnospiraceae bacterium]
MDGILNIRKESGYTSHDVVAKLRGILHMRKIGHTGTLDPMAEGVLPVCVGAATKLVSQLSDHDKEYEAVMVLGKTYDTLDVTGVLLSESEVMLTNEEIEDAVRSFIGGYDQVPPMYSAKKVDGKKLVDIARAGGVIERKPVFVNIYDIVILDVDIPYVTILVKCGKGTYIRSLIDDIGKKLGCGAAMSKLTRTRSGDFGLDGSHTLSDVEEAVKSGRLPDIMLGIEEIFSGLDAIYTTAELSRLVRNGNVFSAKGVERKEGISKRPDEGERFRVYDADGKLAGIYEYKTAGDIYKPYRMFL